MEPLWYEDYGPDVELLTLGRTVTETYLVGFIALCGMYQSLFIDEEYLKRQSPYSGRLVPGALVY